jgi:hypothetical protein
MLQKRRLLLQVPSSVLVLLKGLSCKSQQVSLGILLHSHELCQQAVQQGFEVCPSSTAVYSKSLFRPQPRQSL